MSLLNHPDFETCIKPWCAAVARGEEPPRVELCDSNGRWVEVPVWYDARRYRLVQHKIKIGNREVNAPVEDGVCDLWVSGCEMDVSESILFATEADALAARDAIIAMLRGDE